MCTVTTYYAVPCVVGVVFEGESQRNRNLLSMKRAVQLSDDIASKPFLLALVYLQDFHPVICHDVAVHFACGIGQVEVVSLEAGASVAGRNTVLVQVNNIHHNLSVAALDCTLILPRPPHSSHPLF